MSLTTAEFWRASNPGLALLPAPPTPDCRAAVAARAGGGGARGGQASWPHTPSGLQELCVHVVVVVMQQTDDKQQQQSGRKGLGVRVQVGRCERGQQLPVERGAAAAADPREAAVSTSSVSG